MDIKTELFREEDQSITLAIDLEGYLAGFLQVNQTGRTLNPSVKAEFLDAHRDLVAFFQDMRGVVLMDDMMDACLEQYTPEEQAVIRVSPAFDLLHDSIRELLKNSIDVFLENHLRDPEDRSTQISFNFNVRVFADGVIISFADSGAGFPSLILRDLANEKKQLQYAQEHKISNKRSQHVLGLLGGGAFGLRQLICQILTGQELKPGTKLKRANHFSSAIHFDNDNNPYCRGACIQIMTQIAPISELTSDNEMSHRLRDDGLESRNSDATASTSSESASPSSVEAHPRSQKKSSLGLSIDISSTEDSNRFSGTSPVIQKRDQSSKKSSLGLSIDISSTEDSNRFSGTSPVIRKRDQSSKKSSLGLSIEVPSAEESNRFSGSSPVIPVRSKPDFMRETQANYKQRLNKNKKPKNAVKQTGERASEHPGHGKKPSYPH